MKMNVISLAAEAFELIIQFVSTCVQNFLDYNYCMMSMVMQWTNYCKYFFHDFTSNACDILVCYFRDFIAFVKDLNYILKLIGTLVVNIILKIVYFITCSIHHFSNGINSIYLFLNSFYRYSSSVAEKLIEFVTFFVCVVFDAVILILQIGPNLFIILYQSCICILVLIRESILYCLFLLYDQILNIPTYLFSSFCSIPLKAYCGILMLIWVIYSKKKVIIFLKTVSLCIYNVLSYLTVILLVAFCTVAYSLKSIVLPFLRASLSKAFFKRTQSSRNSVHQFSFTQSCRNILLAFKAFKEKFQSVELSNNMKESDFNQLKKALYEEKEKSFCVVCQDRERNIILLPCRHLCTCRECANHLQTEYRHCPLCRNIILSTLLVYT